MSRAKLPQISLQTQIDGPADAPWMILSNSLGANHAMWDLQIPLLIRRFRVLRYDSRGHGASDVPRGAYSFAQLTGDVIDLMDNFGIEKASFMGLSMGGMTGLGLALDHGDRFHRVICADGRADAPEPFRAMWDERIAKVRDGGLAAIVDATLASWMTPEWHVANPQSAQAVRAMVLATDPQGYMSCCLALKELDYLRRLGEVRIPLLYVGGAKDMGAAPAVMQAMADATPGGTYVEIPDAAHVANINAPDAFNSAITPFLGL